MERSDQINELAAALAGAQAQIKRAVKELTNPHFRSRYADLASVWEACRGPLAAAGLAVAQTPEVLADGRAGLRTTLLHTSGQWIGSTIPLLFEQPTMPAMGSALTYARRYGLAAMVGVVADADDDGQAAAQARPRERERQPSQARPEHVPEPEPSRAEARGRVRGPTSGGRLYHWCKDHDDRDGTDLVEHVKEWAQGQGFPGKMTIWSPDQVSRAYAEAVQRLRGAREPAAGAGVTR